MVILYPIGASYTAPAIRSMAEQAARCQVMDDLLGDIRKTDIEAHNQAVIEFRAFSKRHEDIVLTDNVEALKRLYVDAYERMYGKCYSQAIAKLERMAKARKHCAD